MIRHTLVFIFLAILLSSCASIFSRSVYPVRIKTVPSGLTVRVTDYHGKVLYKNKTPFNTDLKASQGFFKAARYNLEIINGDDVVQQDQIHAALDKIYLLNIPTLIGLLIDPATGAMYRFKEIEKLIRADK